MSQQEPRLVQDQLTIRRVQAPNRALAGDEVTVSATVHCGAPPLTDCETIVKFVPSSGATVRKPASGFTGVGNQQTFQTNATFAMTKQDLTVEVQAIERDVAGKKTTDSETVTIEHLTPAQQRRELVEMAGFAVAGGALAGGGAFALDQPLLESAGAALGGAAVGIGVEASLDRL